MDELQIVTLATIASALLFAGLLFLSNRDFSRWVFILFVAFDMVFLLGWRILARIIFRVGRMPAAERHVLIVGAGEVGQRVGQMIQDYRSMGLNLTGFLDEVVDNGSESDEYVVHVLGRVEDVREVVQALSLIHI